MRELFDDIEIQELRGAINLLHNFYDMKDMFVQDMFIKTKNIILANKILDSIASTVRSSIGDKLIDALKQYNNNSIILITSIVDYNKFRFRRDEIERRISSIIYTRESDDLINFFVFLYQRQLSINPGRIKGVSVDGDSEAVVKEKLGVSDKEIDANRIEEDFEEDDSSNINETEESDSNVSEENSNKEDEEIEEID